LFIVNIYKVNILCIEVFYILINKWFWQANEIGQQEDQKLKSETHVKFSVAIVG
jgi:hypothetical protein